MVDDAIVVVEAVHAKLDEGEHDPKKATLSAMSEITGAIVSITLVMSAVFIPVSFLNGPSGVFYKQFAITLAVSIVISAVNALTLSPALCALFLKPHTDHGEHKKKGIKDRFFTAFNAGFDSMNNKYVGSLKRMAKRRWTTGVILVVFVGLTYWLFTTTPSGFIPNEDRGIIMSDITLPPGTTLEKTQLAVNQLDSILANHPLVEARMSVVGFSLLNRVNGGSYAFTIIKLKDWSHRKEKNQSVDAIVGELFAKTAGFKDARLLFFTPPSVNGFGTADGFEFKIQDTGDDDWATVSKVSNEFLAELGKRPEIQYAMTNFNPGFPQYQMDINVERAKDAGVTVSLSLIHI